MSPASAEPSRLRDLGDALVGLRDCARAGADEVLGLYPDVGDRETQQAVERCLDDLADLLGSLEASASSVIEALEVVTRVASPAPAPATDRRPGITDGSLRR